MTMLRYTGGSRTSGYALLRDGEGNITERETVSCVHCQFIWQIEPGSGRKRGFCYNCNGLVCGKQQCLEHCTPFEKAIEDMERKSRFNESIEREQALARKAAQQALRQLGVG
jgi:hypothetical protein